MCAWLLVVVELALVLLSHREQLASVWELQFGIVGLLPSVLVASASLGAAGGAAWLLARQGEEKVPRLVLAGLSLAFGAATGWGVGGGRHLAELQPRLGFALAVGCVAGTSLYALAPTVARSIRDRPAWVGAANAAVLLLVELTNRFVLVRNYPAFHLALAALALLLAPGLYLAIVPGLPTWRRQHFIALGAGLSLCALGAVPGARLLAGFDNFRILLLEHAAVVSTGVQLTAKLAPVTPPRAEACDGSEHCWELSAEPASSKGSLDLSGLDLLLITVDALRADHLGSYGYSKNTTPNIDRLAKGGALFRYAYAVTPHTSYSVTSLMTGKYMRPLLLQGAGRDSDTWATTLRTYGYRTAAFYPPAVFFIDPDRFETFKEQGLGFEYRKVEFAEGERRVEQVQAYLEKQSKSQRVFLWVHLFAPHEPYEARPGFAFGDRDVDRYDSEVAFADATIGQLARLFRKDRPNAAVFVTSDHGEEFGEHGGRYHGSSVYEEQVRVPLIVNAPGRVPEGRVVEECVQTIDLLPTVLGALQIPRPPRLRGRDLGSLLTGEQKDGEGMAAAETEDQTLLAESSFRLVCARRVGACRLYDLETDPEQHKDASRVDPERFERMKKLQKRLSASHGRFETMGLRAEGKGWPAPILRGVTGDGSAAPEIAELLDDADLHVRRKAAELLFELGRPETAPSLRLALSRAEDDVVRRWCALALTRLGQGAPLAYDLFKSKDEKWRRLAALALAESGDHRGADTLVLWWRDAKSRDYKRSREILAALAKTRDKDAVWPLVQSMSDVRLRPHIARTLAAIGDEFARGPIAKALKTERYQSARVALTEAMVALGAKEDLAPSLRRFLGVPDPLPGGLGFARQARILEQIGGPNRRVLDKLHKLSEIGVGMTVIVPKGGNGRGIRWLARARTLGDEPGMIQLGLRDQPLRYDNEGMPIKIREIPRLDPERSARLDVPASKEFVELYTTLPESLGLRPGRLASIVVFADHQVELDAVALVPLADELPPPAPKPWKQASDTEDSAEDRPAGQDTPEQP